MVELIDTLTSWRTFVLALIVFGVAPGLVLRLLMLAYPKRAPRRRELVAELYAVPRIKRPLWLAEQIELVLVEGLALRLRAAYAVLRPASPVELLATWMRIRGFSAAAVAVDLVMLGIMHVLKAPPRWVEIAAGLVVALAIVAHPLLNWILPKQARAWEARQQVELSDRCEKR